MPLGLRALETNKIFFASSEVLTKLNALLRKRRFIVCRASRLRCVHLLKLMPGFIPFGSQCLRQQVHSAGHPARACELQHRAWRRTRRHGDVHQLPCPFASEFDWTTPLPSPAAVALAMDALLAAAGGGGPEGSNWTTSGGGPAGSIGGAASAETSSAMAGTVCATGPTIVRFSASVSSGIAHQTQGPFHDRAPCLPQFSCVVSPGPLLRWRRRHTFRQASASQCRRKRHLRLYSSPPAPPRPEWELPPKLVHS